MNEKAANEKAMKEKRNAKAIWVLGHHAIDAVLKSKPERALELLVVPSSNNAAQQSIIEQASAYGIPTHQVDKQALAKRTSSDQHQGVGLLAKPKQDGNEKDLDKFVAALMHNQQPMQERHPPLLLILDQVQDPHNFGACLRTADAAGVSAVIVAKDNASPMTPVVQKVASGAAETVNIFRVTNLARSMQALQQQGIWMIGTSDKASHSLYQEDLTGPIAIVMGAEGRGLRQLTEKNCDSLLSLPMAGSFVSSLNVSVATGVCLFEAVRQRQFKAGKQQNV